MDGLEIVTEPVRLAAPRPIFLVAPARRRAAGKEIAEQTLTDQTQLSDLGQTSISIIVNPAQSLPILKSLYPTPPSSNEPHGVWFQPGADDDAVRAYVKERGLEDRVVVGGRCVLVDGDRILRSIKEVGKL